MNKYNIKKGAPPLLTHNYDTRTFKFNANVSSLNRWTGFTSHPTLNANLCHLANYNLVLISVTKKTRETISSLHGLLYMTMKWQ